MDYKNNILLITQLDNEIYEFIDSRTEKNILRSVDIVENYISSLNINEFSIKSFKAKIIHNELEHRRTAEDFQKLLISSEKKIEEIFNTIFENYLDTVKKSKGSLTKVNDLREYEITKRRQRQDVVNRMNSLEKDYQAKKQQDKEQYKSKYDEYLLSLQEESRKLNIDINRIKEAIIKSYGAEEKELLATDDKKRILELKEIIKEKRIEGLKQEYEQKMKSYNEIREKKIAFLDIEKDYDLLVNTQLTEHQEKIAELKHQIKEIESQIKINSFNYDCNYKIKLYEKLRDAKSILSSLLRNHNDFLYKYELNNLSLDLEAKFKIAFILTKLYQMIVTIYEYNIYDPFADVLEELIKINKTNNENYGKTINKMKQKLIEDSEKLKSALDAISLDEKTEKRMSKDDLKENVLSSINRYYTNIINELYMFNDGLQKLMIYTIKYISKKYESIMETSIFAYNDCVFLNTHYDGLDIEGLGYKTFELNSEETMTISEYYSALGNRIENFGNVINTDYQKNVRSMEKQIALYDNKVQEETLKHKVNMEKMSKNHEQTIKRFEVNYIKIKNKKSKKLEREFKKHCDIAKKYMKHKRRVL